MGLATGLIKERAAIIVVGVRTLECFRPLVWRKWELKAFILSSSFGLVAVKSAKLRHDAF